MRLLCGLDLRVDGHEWILDPARYLADRLDGRVDLLFVLAGQELSRVASRREALHALMERLPENRRGDCVLEPGDPVDVLIAQSAARDVLVVGPKEPGPLQRMLKGSMAARVLRSTSKPIYVPRPALTRAEKARCVVGVDLAGGHAATLVRMAGAWVAKMGGVLDAVWVDTRGEASTEELRRPVRERIASLLAENVDEPHRGQPQIASGEPEVALIDVSERYDVLIVGSLARTGLAGFLLGSVAENLLRQAHCDVVVLTAHT